MRARGVVLLALVLALPTLSGCLSFFDKDKDGKKGAVQPADVGYDPDTIRITAVEQHDATVTSFDGTELAVVAYEPQSSDLAPGGKTPTFGTVIFAHGWGFFKETYQGSGGSTGAPVPPNEEVPYSVNRLEAFAQNGLIAVAYDARGFGQSGGVSTVAGAAELQDLEAVRAWAESTFHSNGLFGVVGVSYGGGQALQAWVDNPRITTVVPMYGWVDLYQGLLPGNVPKAEWAAMLASVGAGGSHGTLAQNPTFADWYAKAVQRSGLESVQAEMAARSAAGRMGAVTKPLFACQGMQESLFPQIDQAWQEAGGFTRAYVFTGGHGTVDEECWSRALAWFRYFLGGFETGIDGWPALLTSDADGGRMVNYGAFPHPVFTTYYPDGESLETGYASDAQFTVSQNLLNNPFQEPSSLWDELGMPANQIPYDMRQDPTASFFATAPITGSQVVLGAPELVLHLADPDNTATPFQVTTQLIHVNAAGQSRILSRGAFAALSDADIVNGTVTVHMHWVKADLAPNDQLVLKVGANDSSWFMPLMANYAVAFDGHSEFHVPYFQG